MRATAPRVLLCTSQPPLDRQVRRTADGRDVTREYADLCRASWRRAAATPLSVNARAEQGSGFEDACDAHILVDRDASALAGKPLVHLDDLLGALARFPDHTHLAIVNADILLEVATDAGRFPPGDARTFVAGARIDIEDLDDRSGRRFRHGFDVFVLTREQVGVVTGSGLVIGAPWWDHYVPVVLILAGHRPAGDDPPLAVSLRHEQRWDARLWFLLGEEYVRLVAARVARRHLAAPATRTFAVRLLLARAAFAVGLGRLPGAVGAWARTRLLDRVSRANVVLVERSRTEVPR